MMCTCMTMHMLIEKSSRTSLSKQEFEKLNTNYHIVKISHLQVKYKETYVNIKVYYTPPFINLNFLKIYICSFNKINYKI